MSFTSRLVYNGGFSASETADTTTSPSGASSGLKRSFSGSGMTTTLNTTGTPAIYGRIIDISLTLGGASTTIDLTAAPLAADITKTVDLTGKKLVAYSFRAPATNGGNLIVKPGASDGYNLFIGASEQRTLEPGRHAQSTVASGSPTGAAAIDATHKNITIAGAAGYVLIATLVFA